MVSLTQRNPFIIELREGLRGSCKHSSSQNCRFPIRRLWAMISKNSNTMKSELKKVGDVWDSKTGASGARRPAGGGNWWGNSIVQRHVNRLICGKPLAGGGAGVRERMKSILNGAHGFERAVSIGCGTAEKELRLISEGIVGHFDLYELSEKRASVGLAKAKAAEIESQVTFCVQDAFQQQQSERYDLVYWDNSLHHMMDVDEAVAWSKACLRPGGWLVMNDFVGPSRFQWDDYNIEICNRIRSMLPEHYFRRPGDDSAMFKRLISRPTPEKIIALDPSEAADSTRIIPSLNKYFPGAIISPTGGAIYHIGFAGLYGNMDMSDQYDRGIVDWMLLVDEVLMRQGLTHYAFAVCQV